MDTDDRSFLQTLGDAGYNALMGAIVGGVVQTADGMIKSVRSDPKTLAQQAADAAIAQFKAQTGDAAKPTLAQQIDSMRQQLMNMQRQKKVDALMAAYEKNVPSSLLENPNMESFVKKTSPIDENLLEINWENSKIETGAMKGAYSDKNDPDGSKRESHAERYYAALRNSNSKSIITAISKNSRIDEESVSKMFDHLILNEYELDKGYTHFDSDYYIAESLRRLREGTNIQPHDLVLIQHEAMEHDLMNNEGLNYDEAHAIANKSYNYQEALIAWLKKEGK